MPWTSAELLERALRDDEEIPLQELEHMLAANTKEDLHLDWKSGQLLSEPSTRKDAATGIKGDVAGFANGDAGVLVIGARGGDVSDPKWVLDPCPPKVGNQPAMEWVHALLADLRATLRPLPKVRSVGPNGEVILIAVERSEQLTAVVVPGKGPLHYLRFYGSTHPVPPYLLADLLVGRRQRPQFELTIEKAQIGPTIDDQLRIKERQLREVLSRPLSVQLTMTLHNVGLVWAEQPIVGWVAHSGALSEAQQRSGDDALNHVPKSVWPYVTGRHVGSLALDHGHTRATDMLPPFTSKGGLTIGGTTATCAGLTDAWEKGHQRHHRPDGGMPVGMPYSVDGNWRIHWLAPVYVTCRNSPPQWFQLRLVFDENRTWLPEESVIEAADGTPVVDIQVFARGFDDGQSWRRVVGWGNNPLESATE